MKIIGYKEILDKDEEQTGICEVYVRTWLGGTKTYTGTILGLFDLTTGTKWDDGAKAFTEYVLLEQLREKLAEIRKPTIKAVD